MHTFKHWHTYFFFGFSLFLHWTFYSACIFIRFLFFSLFFLFFSSTFLFKSHLILFCRCLLLELYSIPSKFYFFRKMNAKYTWYITYIQNILSKIVEFLHNFVTITWLTTNLIDWQRFLHNIPFEIEFGWVFCMKFITITTAFLFPIHMRMCVYFFSLFFFVLFFSFSMFKCLIG